MHRQCIKKTHFIILLALSIVLNACTPVDESPPALKDAPPMTPIVTFVPIAPRPTPTLMPWTEQQNDLALDGLIRDYIEFLNDRDYEMHKHIFIGTAELAFDSIFEKGDNGWVNYIISAELIDVLPLTDEIYREVWFKGTKPIVYEEEKGYVLKLKYALSKEVFTKTNGINYEIVQFAIKNGKWSIERIEWMDMYRLNEYVIPEAFDPELALRRPQ